MKNKNIKILLVDDEPDIHELVSYNLKNEGYSVYTAKDGKEAVKAAKSIVPHLILLDIMMPEMNGFEITIEIRKHEKATGVENPVPIIALTANTLDNDKNRCIEVGMNEYLSKPFTSNQLVAKIEKFIQPV